jgi:hypothetical protein
MQELQSALNGGAMSASDLRTRLGVSPATMMRMVRQAGPAVVRVGRGRATQYALRQSWPNLALASFPVFRISQAGEAVLAGELVTLAGRQSIWLPSGDVVDGLPIALADARPSGFLGRHFAAVHTDLRLPLRISDWSDHHILIAMSSRGEDLPGDLLVGEESFARWQALASVDASPRDYPTLADVTIAGHPPGSSAGGERPKFGVCVEGRHVLVKFATRGSATDVVARRWCDLLVLEAIALEVIALSGIAAARTAIIDTPRHRLLESERFDRVGRRGRRGVLSLAAVSDDLSGSWSAAATHLHAAGRITSEDARRLCWLDAFGALIGNTDRHQHNIVFFADSGELSLAPAFDQVSMLYAPTADGQVPDRRFALPVASATTIGVWGEARKAARQFWERGSGDPRLSAGMQAICGVNAGLFV